MTFSTLESPRRRGGAPYPYDRGVKLVPTRRTDYGIRALIYLARHPAEFVKADDIADEMELPRNFVPQVLQDLQRARLVRSRPSRHGGYALALPAEEISILHIVEALEGRLDDVECALRGGPCHWEDVCALHWVWSSAREALAEKLHEATLARVAADDEALATGARVAPPNSHRRKAAARPAASPKAKKRPKSSS